MESSRPPILNLQKYTARLKQYLRVRRDWWDSSVGKVHAYYRDDATIRTKECVRLNTDLYRLYIPDSYLFYFAADLKEVLSHHYQEKIENYIKQHQLRNAFIFIANKHSIVRRAVENGVLTDHKEEITAKKEGKFDLQAIIMQLVENDLKHDTIFLLSKSKIKLIVDNTNHHHAKQLKDFLKIIYKLGEASLSESGHLENSYFSETCHGIRADIISVMKKSILEEELKANIKNKNDKLIRIQSELNKLDAAIQTEKASLGQITDTTAKAKKIAGIEEEKKKLEGINHTYLKMLFKLCLLGDMPSLMKAENSLLIKLDRPPSPGPTPTTFQFSLDLIKSTNPYLPYIFHENYDEFLHENNCRKLANIKDLEEEYRQHLKSYTEFETAVMNFPTNISEPKIDCHLPHSVKNTFSTVSDTITSGVGVLLKFGGLYYSKTPSNPQLTGSDDSLVSLNLSNSNK